MSNESSKTMSQEKKCPTTETLPDWAKPILVTCEVVSPFFLMLGALLLILAFALISLKRVDLTWLYNVISGFGLFASVGMLAIIIAKYKSVLVSWTGAVIGVALYFSRLLIVIIGRHVGLPVNEHVLMSFESTCASVGVFILVVSVISLMATYIRHFLYNERQRRAERFVYATATSKNVEKPGLIPKCWQMSRCRPSVRLSCPNYVDHVTCWKRRSGCFCDRSLANHLIGTSGKGEAQEAMDVQKLANAENTVNAMRGHMTDKSNRRPWREQKRLCLSCPLFVEHQEYKYKHYSWLSFPVTAGIVAGVYKFFDVGYTYSMHYIDTLLARSIHLPYGNINISTSLASGPFEYFLVGVLSLLLLSYVIGFTDKFFLEWKL